MKKNLCSSQCVIHEKSDKMLLPNDYLSDFYLYVVQSFMHSSVITHKLKIYCGFFFQKVECCLTPVDKFTFLFTTLDRDN